MNRNTVAHMGNIPKIGARRSAFDRSLTVKTTGNTGDCIPVWWDEVYPGDTIECDMAGVMRMATPVFPVMDNAFTDFYWFFVPTRLTWDHWQAFWGENDDPWTQTTEYVTPKISTPSGGYARHTIADYMGIPTYVEKEGINVLPLRAYTKIMNDWFRSENVDYSCHLYTDDNNRTGSNGGNYVTDTELGGKPYKANKIPDLYTRALPEPQKGPDVSIPIGATAPVTGSISTTIGGTSTGRIDTSAFPVMTNELIANSNGPGLTWYLPNEGETFTPDTDHLIFGHATHNKAMSTFADGTNTTTTNGRTIVPSNLWAKTTRGESDFKGVTITNNLTATSTPNLSADLSDATSTTINELRTAFAIQKFYEAQARGGSRYIEFLANIFGVTSSDARLQRSEYLGGKRQPINMETVLQTSSTDAVSPQGNTAGYSCTLMRDSMFTKSFEEHGFIFCIMVTRTEHTYQQGLEKKWTRSKWTDFYNPFFANLGEQPIYNENIYMQGTDKDKEVFGYQESWAELRYAPNVATGDFRSNSPAGSLKSWTYEDVYASLPTLSETWLREPVTNVDQTLAAQSSITHQFWVDLYLKMKWVRNLPIYGLPGLIDHV